MPGVGHFGQASRTLEATGLGAAVREAAAGGQAVMGICLGLQLFFASSAEAPEARGLGILPGRVVRFETTLSVPHVGWARVDPTTAGASHPVLAGVFRGQPQFFYHVHSYHPAGVTDDDVLATGTYDGRLPHDGGTRQRGGRAVPPGEVAARRHRAARRVRAVAPVTSVRVSLVDLYVLRGAGPSLECLVLRRAAGGRCPGSWEAVHGHIEPGETPGRGGASGAGRGDGTRARASVQPEPGRDVLSAPARRGGARAGVRRVRRGRLPPSAPAASTTGSSGSRRPRPGDGSPGPASAARWRTSWRSSARERRGRWRTCFAYASPSHHSLSRRGGRPGGQGRAFHHRSVTPAIRWSRPRGTMPTGRTSSSFSTSRPVPRRGAPRSRWSSGSRNPSSSRSPSAAAFGRWPTPGPRFAPERTRCRSIRRRCAIPPSCPGSRRASGRSAWWRRWM